MEYINPEKLIQCPYNKSHYVARKRISFHIIKCRKQHQDSRIATCDFNTTHQVHEIELQYHHENCPDKKKMEICVYHESDVDTDKYPIQNINVETEETWDNYNVNSYNPEVHCENTEVLRKLDVEPDSKKKNFRILERQRLIKLAEKQRALQPPQPVECVETENKNIRSKAMRLLEQLRLGAKTSYISIVKNN